jgi:putative ABC transport system permease protein
MLVRDVLVEISSRRSRAVFTVVGVALSTGTLVAAQEITRVAGDQIASDMAAGLTDELVVTAADGARAPGVGAGDAVLFPLDATERVRDIDLVADAGPAIDLTSAAAVTASRWSGPSRPDGTRVVAASAGYVGARRPDAPPASGWLDRSDPVALLGVDAAADLDVPVVADPTGWQVWVLGQPYQVAGVLPEAGDDLDAAVVIPYTVGTQICGSDRDATFFVRTEVGAGPSVADVVRQAVRPDRPTALVVSEVAALTDLRADVSVQTARLALGVSLFLLVVITLLIGSSMASSVVARTAEIGLRRALGSSPGAVAGVFLVDGAVCGALGGLAGAAGSSVVVVVVCWLNAWTAALSPLTITVAPLVGTLVGVVASGYPAARASRISPAIAVRAD